MLLALIFVDYGGGGGGGDDGGPGGGGGVCLDWFELLVLMMKLQFSYAFGHGLFCWWWWSA